MADIILEGNVGLLPGGGATVFFAADNGKKVSNSYNGGTVARVVEQIQNKLKIAYWGEDNAYPQNIENQLSYCSIAPSALDWKRKALFGSGIIPGRIIQKLKEEGATPEENIYQDVFVPLHRDANKEIYAFLEGITMPQFFTEYSQDWVWFHNCFPELIFSNDCSKITGIVHQESCDCRYEQMNEEGKTEHVFISKIWGNTSYQMVKFDPQKGYNNISYIRGGDYVDTKYVKRVPCLDMYDPMRSLQNFREKYSKASGPKTAILPVNYPSPNKTYYQKPYWDGARLSGWVEIASKIPVLMKAMYNKAFKLKYHIEVPLTYFEQKFGVDVWRAKSADEQDMERRALLKQMNNFLSDPNNSYTTFVSFFNISSTDKSVEYGRIKITEIQDKSSVDKELFSSSAANMEILMAMQVHPSLFNAGAAGSMYRSGGGSGSDIREAFNVYNALLYSERQLALQPLKVIAAYNGWGDDIVFSVKDVELTTLDTGRSAKIIDRA